MDQFNVTDFVLFFVFILFALRGFLRGFYREILGLAQIFVLLFSFFVFFNDIHRFLLEHVSSDLSYLHTILIILLTVFLGFFLLGNLIERLTYTLHLRFFDRILGFVMGSVIGLGVILLIDAIQYRVQSLINIDALSGGQISNSIFFSIITPQIWKLLGLAP